MQPQSYATFHEAYIEGISDTLHNFAFFAASYDGQIAFQEVATPLTHARYTGATGGTSYGIAATPGQMALRRAAAT